MEKNIGRLKRLIKSLTIGLILRLFQICQFQFSKMKPSAATLTLLLVAMLTHIQGALASPIQSTVVEVEPTQVLDLRDADPETLKSHRYHNLGMLIVSEGQGKNVSLLPDSLPVTELKSNDPLLVFLDYGVAQAGQRRTPLAPRLDILATLEVLEKRTPQIVPPAYLPHTRADMRFYDNLDRTHELMKSLLRAGVPSLLLSTRAVSGTQRFMSLREPRLDIETLVTGPVGFVSGGEVQFLSFSSRVEQVQFSQSADALANVARLALQEWSKSRRQSSPSVASEDGLNARPCEGALSTLSASREIPPATPFNSLGGRERNEGPLTRPIDVSEGPNQIKHLF